MFSVEDVDNVYPDDFTLVVENGDHYSIDQSTIIPESDYNGTIDVAILVTMVSGRVINLLLVLMSLLSMMLL